MAEEVSRALSAASRATMSFLGQATATASATASASAVVKAIKTAGVASSRVSWGELAVQTAMISTATAVVYATSHAAITRPPSAAPPDKHALDETADLLDPLDPAASRRRKTKTTDATEPEAGTNTHTLQLSDALLLPVVSGVVLSGLYVLIKYLDGASAVSLLLRLQSSLMGVFGGTALLGDAAGTLSTLVFPNVWAARDGRVFRFSQSQRRQQWATPSLDDATDTDAPEWTEWTEDDTRTTPFPDAVARWVPAALAGPCWAVRGFLRTQWTLRPDTKSTVVNALVRGILAICDEFDEGESKTEKTDETEKTKKKEKDLTVGMTGVLGLVGALATSGVYMYTNLRGATTPGLLNNLLGMSAVYLGIAQVSGTSFVISSAVLAVMFVYDVVMVFYSPMMVTVATKIEAPLMLAMRVGGRRSMLGLGDLAVPCVLVALCLRFDQHRFYLARQTRAPTTLATTTTAGTTHTATTRTVKAAYVDPRGRWGDRAWAGSTSRHVDARLTPGLAAASFPKPFFHGAMLAYVAGLVLADVAVVLTRKGQPALFYLVPALLLATWGQAAARGLVEQMWQYTESGALDTEDVVVDVDAHGRRIDPKKDQ